MRVAPKDSFLKWSDMFSQEIEPLSVHANLAHVNVPSRDVFITPFQTGILFIVNIDVICCRSLFQQLLK